MTPKSLQFISLQEGLLFNRQLPGFIHLPVKVDEPDYEAYRLSEDAYILSQRTEKREAVLM